MLISELEKVGIKVHIIPDLVREIPPIKYIKAFFKLQQIVKSGNYGVIHARLSKVRFLIGFIAKLLKVPKLVYTVHGWWHIEQYKGLKRKMFILAERFGAKFCDKIVLLCKRDMEKAKMWKIGKQEQYEIIPNAIVPIGSIQKGKLRKELRIMKNANIIGNVARLDLQKNSFRFLEIVN